MAPVRNRSWDKLAGTLPHRRGPGFNTPVPGCLCKSCQRESPERSEGRPTATEALTVSYEAERRMTLALRDSFRRMFELEAYEILRSGSGKRPRSDG